jgi:hypothetical protein
MHGRHRSAPGTEHVPPELPRNCSLVVIADHEHSLAHRFIHHIVIVAIDGFGASCQDSVQVTVIGLPSVSSGYGFLGFAVLGIAITLLYIARKKRVVS